MSILIKGMEMPQGCFYCICNKHLDPDTDMCILTREAFDSTFRVIEHRRDNCPLVSVPPHGRLGDLDALAQQIEHERFHHTHTDGLTARHHVAEYGHFLKAISDAPTVIDAEKGET